MKPRIVRLPSPERPSPFFYRMEHEHRTVILGDRFAGSQIANTAHHDGRSSVVPKSRDRYVPLRVRRPAGLVAIPDHARVARMVEQGERRIDRTADEDGLLLRVVAPRRPQFGHFERVELEHHQVVQQQASDERLVVGHAAAVRVREVSRFVLQATQVERGHVRPVQHVLVGPRPSVSDQIVHVRVTVVVRRLVVRTRLSRLRTNPLRVHRSSLFALQIFRQPIVYR